jgi:tRNA (Thr-GGU) A37 N-methylase
MLLAPTRPNKTAFSTMKLKQFAGIAIQLQQLFPE